MSEESKAQHYTIVRFKERGTPVSSRHARHILSMDSITIGHFRRAAALLSELGERGE